MRAPPSLSLSFSVSPSTFCFFFFFFFLYNFQAVACSLQSACRTASILPLLLQVSVNKWSTPQPGFSAAWPRIVFSWGRSQGRQVIHRESQGPLVLGLPLLFSNAPAPFLPLSFPPTSTYSQTFLHLQNGESKTPVQHQPTLWGWGGDIVLLISPTHSESFLLSQATGRIFQPDQEFPLNLQLLN